MYELRSDPKKKPIRVDSYEEAKALVDLCKQKFGREIQVSRGTIPVEFDADSYNYYLSSHWVVLIEKGVECIVRSVNLVILGKDLADFENVDYYELLSPIMENNDNLVQQYQSGNEKALNALMGKFLKDNKGYGAGDIKLALIELMK